MASLGAPRKNAPAVLGGEAGQIKGNKTPDVYTRLQWRSPDAVSLKA
jgi:hypothetical protein